MESLILSHVYSLTHPVKLVFLCVMFILFLFHFIFAFSYSSCNIRVMIFSLYSSRSVRQCVCVSVCLCVHDYSRTTGYEAAYELYQQLQCYKGKIKNVAILLKPLRSGDMA